MEELTKVLINQLSIMKILQCAILMCLSHFAMGQFTYEEIEIGCLNRPILDPIQLINNQDEYNKLYNAISPHPDCKDFKLPEINFVKNVLIGFIANTQGCKEPEFRIDSRTEENQNCNLILTIESFGICRLNWPITKWFIVERNDCGHVNGEIKYN